jgi:hypothetical protein
MSRKLYGTRFTTGCGHSWRKRYPKWTVRDLSHASTDCKVCGELLMIPGEQFEGTDPNAYPFAVHMPLFHAYLHAQDPDWPADGRGTGYVEFPTDET